MLLGKKRLNKFISTYIKSLGFNYKCKLDTDFAFLPNRNIILYSLTLPELSNKAFLTYAYRLGLEHEVDPFIISLFHEIGHDETWDTLSTCELVQSLRIKDNLSKIDNYSYKDYLTYFKAPDERAATKWAVEYINENIDNINNFYNDLLNELNIFYKKNNITNN